MHTKKYKSKKRPVVRNPRVAGTGKGQREHTHGLPVPIPKVLAKWEAPGVSGGEEGYVGIDGLGMTGASLGIGTRGASKGIAEPEPELGLLELWCVNGAGAVHTPEFE